MALSKVIGRNIKHIRETKGIKQVHLAKILKMTPASMSYIENGKSDVSIGKLEKIAKALEVNILDFFSRSLYEDPLADRKRVLEEAAIGLVNMYNDLAHQRSTDRIFMSQMDELVKTQAQIIDLLKDLLKIPKNPDE